MGRSNDVTVEVLPQEPDGLPLWAWAVIGIAGVAVVGGVAYALTKKG